jgi:hypothetical protein
MDPKISIAAAVAAALAIAAYMLLGPTDSYSPKPTAPPPGAAAPK